MVVGVTGIKDDDSSPKNYSLLQKLSRAVYNQILKLFDILQKSNRESIAQFAALQDIPKASVEEIANQTKKECKDADLPRGVDELNCYAEQFEDISIKYGSKYAFKVLSALQKIDKEALNCHFIAHGIGWGAYKKHKNDLGTQITSMDTSCSYGAIHGILEQYIATLPEGKLNKNYLTDICGSNPNANCVHGIGHIILVETKGDMEAAVELCSAFQQEGPHQMCLNGAYMEHMIA